MSFIDCIGLISGIMFSARGCRQHIGRIFFYVQIHTDQNPSESLVGALLLNVPETSIQQFACCSIQPCKSIMGKSGSSIVKVSVVNILGKATNQKREPQCQRAQVCLFFASLCLQQFDNLLLYLLFYQMKYYYLDILYNVRNMF